MFTLRKAADRFHTRIDWLDSWHSFSFGEHYDPRQMGFGPLRVINEDRIAGGGGFPTHPHRDMEIITVVLEGALSHKDSLGTGSTIRPGDVQKMSAGTGIRHSEFNALPDEETHLLQIWIEPGKTGIAPEYRQLHFTPEQRKNRFCLAAGPDAGTDIIPVYQDARLFLADLSSAHALTHEAAGNRKLWLQVVKGSVEAGGQTLRAGDGLAAQGERTLSVTARADSSVLLFDMG